MCQLVYNRPQRTFTQGPAFLVHKESRLPVLSTEHVVVESSHGFLAKSNSFGPAVGW